MLDQLETQAFQRGLRLRLKVGRPFGLWTLRVVVARPSDATTFELLGELKAWAYASTHGLQLDTMRVVPKAPAGVGDLIWAATMCWALEATPCRQARLLAIRDDDRQHQRLVRYFRQKGFNTVRELEAALGDLPLRLLWGGAGALMTGSIEQVRDKSLNSWRQSAA